MFHVCQVDALALPSLIYLHDAILSFHHRYLTFDGSDVPAANIDSVYGRSFVMFIVHGWSNVSLINEYLLT